MQVYRTSTGHSSCEACGFLVKMFYLKIVEAIQTGSKLQTKPRQLLQWHMLASVLNQPSCIMQAVD